MSEKIQNEDDLAIRNTDEARPIQIVNVDKETRQFVLDEEALGSILLHEKAKDRPVAVVSIAGDFRKGKSFMLNFFLRYLKCLESNSADSWLDDKDLPLKGFSWRAGAERDTTGILMWSEPILVEQNGKKIAVLLMDTQGAFDDEHTVKDSATVFALSTLLSSIQVYNILHNLQEDNLQTLQVFTEYGRLVSEDTKEAPFQKLMFLIRDWSFPFQYGFGLTGGQQFLEKKLTVRDTQPLQLQQVRKHIRSCFKEIECFLMPYPGKKVATNPHFDGSIESIEEDFIENLSVFVPLMLDPSNIQVKEIAGQRITGMQLMEYFKTYLEAFGGEDMPQPKTMLEATAEANNLAASACARDLYKHEMEDICGGSKPYVNSRVLEEKNLAIMQRAMDTFNQIPKMGGPSFSEPHAERLKEELLAMFEQYKLNNNNKNIFSTLGAPLVFGIWIVICLFSSKIFDVLGIAILSSMFVLFSTITLAVCLMYFFFRIQGTNPDFVSGLDNVSEFIWSYAMDLTMKFVRLQIEKNAGLPNQKKNTSEANAFSTHARSPSTGNSKNRLKQD